MKETYEMKIIAHICSDFPTKFGIPRQSGLVEELCSTIVFEPEYRNPDALRGLEGFSHIWLLWQFSQSICKEWSPTVRPPRLGGNQRVGVFASRSPFRPNAIGLSSVRLDSIEQHPHLGPLLHVRGADLMDGTPIFDIKPYVLHSDCHPDSSAGFAAEFRDYALSVTFPPHLLQQVPEEKREALLGVLAQDPHPAYQHDGERIYGLEFAGLEIRFSVNANRLVVREVLPAQRMIK